MTSLRRFLYIVSLNLLALLGACAAPEGLPSTELTPQAKLPSGFRDTLVARVPLPTALAFTPDGRLLITSQGGTLYVLKGGTLKVARRITNICTDSERGLLGVAVDPAFNKNRFIYLYHTTNSSGDCARNSPRSPVNRVVRFVLPDSNVITAKAQVLIDKIPSPNGNHNGGDLHFGNNGLLHVSVGDGGCDPRGGGCAAQNTAARAKNLLSGKILRVTRHGGIPAGNPFAGSNSVRCGVSGSAGAGQRCAEIFALGLRNPFRIAFDPNAPGTRFAINDVGQNTREEVSLGKVGADYGWNLREGRCPTGSSTNCGSVSGLTNPIFDYAHKNSGSFAGCRSISGGAFVPRGLWPASYNSGYLFADFICGKLFMLKRSSSGWTAQTFASGLGNVVHLAFGTYSGKRALYYTSYENGGQVRRIQR